MYILVPIEKFKELTNNDSFIISKKIENLKSIEKQDLESVIKSLGITNSRKRTNIIPLHFLRLFLKRNTKFSLKKIGSFTNNCDHATVINSIKVVTGYIQHDEVMKEQYEAFELEMIDKIQSASNIYEND